jgi:hypothetical protein
MPRISNDRGSGERRSAGLERGAPRCDEDNRDAIDMLDRSRDERHRQLRRLRNKRIGRKLDGGANGAIIVTAAMLVGEQRRTRHSGDGADGRGARNGIEMHVSEREHELQRQRRKRQQAARSPAGTDPPHRQYPHPRLDQSMTDQRAPAIVGRDRATGDRHKLRRTSDTIETNRSIASR